MKVSKSWLKDLVEIKDIEKVIKLLPLRTIALRSVTNDYIELDMKGYNRADLLSMRGVAREVAAITDLRVKFEEENRYVWEERELQTTPVKITEEALSPTQAVAKIERLRVGPSPKEWVERLNACGMRTVNNIADVTNLVMLEYGHPLHAFDEATVKDDTINVRRAKDGEEITTLDGKLRKLTSEDIVLADGEKALDVAGVMGGKETEVKDSTDTILLSASLFNPTMVRKTAAHLKLGSEASKRFYHGLTKKRLLQAFNAAIKMYADLGGNLTAVTIEGETEDKTVSVNLSQEKINSVIGVDIPSQEVENALTKLGFQLESEGNTWRVKVPYWRLDIEIEEDLIEEVVRMHGYERIPAKELVGRKPAEIDQSLFELISKIKHTLVDEGLTEVQTYSFYSTDVLKNVGFAPDYLDTLVKIANPISSETEYLRQHLWTNLVEVIAKNLKYGFEDIAIFEIGKAYYPTQDRPQENYRLCIVLQNGTDNPVQELYAIFKRLMDKLDLKIEAEDPDRTPIDHMLFHPTRFQQLIIKGEAGGGVAEIHPRIVNKFGIEQRVAALEINLKKLLSPQ